MPSGMRGEGRGPNHVLREGSDLRLPARARSIFREELRAMIDALSSHPSIVAWIPFNEGWGQHHTNDVLRWVSDYDRTRLVGGPSGWADRGYGDLVDMHSYPGPAMPHLAAGRAAVLGEFGGLGLPVRGHSWSAANNWGYRAQGSRAELGAAYRKLLEQMPALIGRGLAAAVYTQTTDVEIEVNGLMTYDRAILKVDPNELAELHGSVIATPIGAEQKPADAGQE